MKHSGPGLLFFGRCLITASISVLVIGLFIISISSWFSLGRLTFSKHLSISSRLSILLPYSCPSLSLITVCISALSVVTSTSSFLILLIWFFSLFLMSWGKGLSILFIFSKNQLLVFLIFILVSFFFFHLFLLEFYDLFPSTNFGVSFFSFFQLF